MEMQDLFSAKYAVKVASKWEEVGFWSIGESNLFHKAVVWENFVVPYPLSHITA